MRINHDNGCLWWKDWHSCSCGYLEEQIRYEHIALNQPFKPVEFPEDLLKRARDLVSDVKVDLGEELCSMVIPGTFIMCGEGFGNERQYCSKACMEKDKK